MRQRRGLLKIYQNDKMTQLKIILIDKSYYNNNEKNGLIDDDSEKWKDNIPFLDLKNSQLHQFWTITKEKNKKITLHCSQSNKVKEKINDFFKEEETDVLFSISNVSWFSTPRNIVQEYEKLQEIEPEFLSKKSLAFIIENVFIDTYDDNNDRYLTLPKKIRNKNDSIEGLINILVFMKTISEPMEPIASHFYNTSYVKIITKRGAKVLVIDCIGILLGLILIFSPLMKINIQNYYCKCIAHSFIFIVGLVLFIGFIKSFFNDIQNEEEIKADVDAKLLSYAEEINSSSKAM